MKTESGADMKLGILTSVWNGRNIGRKARQKRMQEIVECII
jgi:hypothetical protein